MAILKDLNAEAMVAELDKLRAENARLKASAQAKIKVKISEKGAICVYGLGRFPVSLYKSQWEKLLAPEVLASIQALFPLAPDKRDD